MHWSVLAGVLEKHGLLHSPPANQRVHHHAAAIDANLAPDIEGAGGGEKVTGVKEAENGGVPESLNGDVEDERGQRVELVLVERSENQRLDGGFNRQEILRQQIVRVLVGDGQPFPGAAHVAMPDGPPAIGQSNGDFPETLETLDEIEAGARGAQSSCHRPGLN